MGGCSIWGCTDLGIIQEELTLVRTSLIWTISYNLIISYIKLEVYNYLRSLILGKLSRSNWLKSNFRGKSARSCKLSMLPNLLSPAVVLERTY
jgi:hypothetical protein